MADLEREMNYVSRTSPSVVRAHAEEIASLRSQLAEAKETIDNQYKRLVESGERVLEIGDELDMSQARVKRLEGALTEYADENAWYASSGHNYLEVIFDSFDAGQHGYERAKRALNAESEASDAAT